MERLMNAGLMIRELPDEYFVLQIDGRVRSGHRRFADALRAALLLRDQFPQQRTCTSSVRGAYDCRGLSPMAISRARATQNSDPCGPSLTPLVSARDVIPFFCLCFPRLSVFASSIQEDSSLRLALRIA